MTIYDHKDAYENLNQPKSLAEKLSYLHETMKLRHGYIDRMAIALHNQDTDVLSTYAFSAEGGSPLQHYDARLQDCPSLLELVRLNRPRLLNDLDLLKEGEQRHTQLIASAGYQASYTVPLFAEGVFLGFLFYNSKQKDVFHEEVLPELDMAAHLLAFMLFSEKGKLNTLVATVRSARDLSHHRDPETGAHLERMAHYSRLIAFELAEKYGFNDQFIEHLFLFSPLHDIGKLTIPDNILLKPGKLTDAEYQVMRTHSQNGREIIDKLLENYGLDGVDYIDLLRNIAMYHHEAVDGSGYPEHLKQEDIPIEARIVAVADVFDALTSHRPYKTAWPNNKAFDKLRELAGSKLDAECVEALLKNTEKIQSIQKTFHENQLG
jgi:HD-GYP domain-containing protein (c-di-GMP phosphodiesterase class II)